MKKKNKLLITLALIGALVGFTAPKTAYATGETIEETPTVFQLPGKNGQESNGCRYFLGLTSWDCGAKNWDEDHLKASLVTVIMNIASDLTILASYLVLGFVIYGGYRYLLSGGDANFTAQGKRILMHSFVGLAIVLLSNVIFNAIRFGVLNGSKATTESIGGVKMTLGSSDPAVMFTSALSWIIGIAGVAALIFIVYGGISYITAAGNPTKIQKAKDAIMYAAIGLVVVGLAEAITAFVTAKIVESKKYGQENVTAIPIVRTISLKEINNEKNC